MMSDKDTSLIVEDAERLLDTVPEYHWLTRNTQAWWSTREIAKGLGVSVNIVLGWCKSRQIPGAVEYPGRWSIPRSALLIFLAKQHLASLPVE